jgi:hypothetical protein
VFENRVLRTIFGPQRNEIIDNLFSSLNVIKMMKSRRTGWAGHVAQGQIGVHTEF